MPIEKKAKWENRQAWKHATQRTEADKEQQREHLTKIFGTDNEKEQELLLTYGHDRTDKPTERKTTTNQHTQAGRELKQTTPHEKIDRLRKLLTTQKYKQRTDLKAKLERVNFWARATNQDQEQDRRRNQDETPEDVKRILNSDLFSNWRKEEGYRYTQYEATTENETTTLRNLAEVGMNHRIHRLPTDIYKRAIEKRASVKEVIEAITSEKRNDLPTRYLLRWLGLSENSIRHYLNTDGKETQTKNKTRTVLTCGIPTHYFIVPRSHPQPDQDLRTGRPLADFIAQIQAQIHRQHRHHDHATETTSDTADNSISYEY